METKERPSLNPRKVIRLAYQPHAGQALFHKSKARFRVMCVPPGTIIPGDYKVVEDIAIGDTGFGLTRINNMVLKTFNDQYSGDLISIHARYILPFRVTPEHPILITPVKRNDNSYAKNMGKRKKKTEWRPGESFWAEASDFGRLLSRQGKYEKYCLTIPRLNDGANIRSFSLNMRGYKYKQTEFPITPETAWAMGLYLAEGHSNNRIGYSLGYDEDDMAERLRRLFTSLGYWCSVRHVGRAILVTISSTALSELFGKIFGRGADKKRIPEQLIVHPDRNIQLSLIRGWIDGDGYFNGRVTQGKTNSEVLALQLQLMVARFGVFTILGKVRRGKTKIFGREYNCRDGYSVEITNRRFLVELGYDVSIEQPQPEFGWVTDKALLTPLKEVLNEPYDGFVYNIHTEDGTYLLSNIVSHNCTGRKWGKTTMLVHEAFRWLGRPNSMIWWVAPYYNLAQLGWRRFREAIPPVAIRNIYKKEQMMEMINGSTMYFKCYDPETEFLTPDGFKKTADVQTIDLVATLNSENQLEYQHPTAVYTYNYKGKMYHLKTRFLDLLVTPNHELYVKPRNGKWGRYPASEIYGKRVSHKRNCEWIGEEILVPDAYIELLGYYITEGHCGPSSVFITQQASQTKRDIIESCIRKLPYQYTPDKRKFNIRSRKLRDEFIKLGRGARNKVLPEWVLKMSRRQLRILFDAMILGDGHIRKKGYWGVYFYTTSSKLADQFQEIILKLGYTGIISYVPPTTNDLLGYTIHSGPQYHISTARYTLTPTVNHGKNSKAIEEWIDYNGPVHCIEVPNHVVLTRRNGKILWCGNSADSPDALVGEGLDLLIIDEAARVKEVVWLESLRPNLSDPSRLGYAVMASSPRGHNWFYREWLKGIMHVPEYEAWGIPVVEIPTTHEKIVDIRGGFPSWSNPYFKLAELQSALKLPQRVFLQEYCARYLEDLGAVFRGVTAAITGRLEPPMIGEEYYIGADLGKVDDYTVVIVTNSQGHVVSFDRWRKHSWTDQVNEIIRIAREYNDASIYIDASGLGDPIYDFIKIRYDNINAVKLSAQKKREVIENLAICIQSGHFTYPEIPELIEELALFGVEQTSAGNIRYEAPEGFHDDCVIAAGLACWGAVKVVSSKLSFEWVVV